MSSKSIVTKVFLELYKLCSQSLDTGNWVSNVKPIFQKINMLHYFKNLVRLWLATKLDVENTTLLDSCILFYMFKNTSDMYTKYAT